MNNFLAGSLRISINEGRPILILHLLLTMKQDHQVLLQLLHPTMIHYQNECYWWNSQCSNIEGNLTTFLKGLILSWTIRSISILLLPICLTSVPSLVPMQFNFRHRQCFPIPLADGDNDDVDSWISFQGSPLYSISCIFLFFYFNIVDNICLSFRGC